MFEQSVFWVLLVIGAAFLVLLLRDKDSNAVDRPSVEVKESPFDKVLGRRAR